MNISNSINLKFHKLHILSIQIEIFVKFIENKMIKLISMQRETFAVDN